MSTSPQYSHMQVVSRAWDSLMEAKHVLQRIENKVDLQNGRGNKAQKYCRRLQMDRGLYSGPDTLSEEISNPVYCEQEEELQRISEQTFTLYRKEPDGHCGSLMSPLKPALVSSKGNSFTKTPMQAEPYLAGRNLGGRSIEKYCLSTSPQNTLAMEISDNFSASRTTEDKYFADEDVEIAKLHPQFPEDAVQVVNPYLSMTSPLSAQDENETSHCSSLVAFTPLLSPISDLYAQKLESLKSRSPGSKLERLKERIREQKRRQEAARKNVTKSRENPEPARKVMATQKIRKVTFGPPPPVYKGFSASNKEATPVYPDESAVTREKESMKKTHHKTQRTVHLQAVGCAKGKTICPVSQKLSFKSISPERKDRSSGYELYRPSAWRKGQKLVQQILGPSPITFRKRSVCEKQEILQHENCIGRCQKIRCQESLKEKYLQHRRDSSQSTDMLQVLRDIQAGKEGLMSPCRSLKEDYERVTNESVSRNVSPKRPRSRTDSHDNKDFGKENIRDSGSGEPNRAKTRSYSVQQVRNFMKRKIIERQKEERKNQREMNKAQQTKREQLSNILRKQKEAFPPKRVSAKTAAYKHNITTGACVTAKVDNIRRDLSEWLHATSSDLLKEEYGCSEKARTHFTEQPFHNECTSTLRLQDLTATNAIHHQDFRDDVHSKEGLNPNNCPDKQSSHRDSQGRVQAIWVAAKDLGRRVDSEMSRFGAIQLKSSVTPVSSNSSSPPMRSVISKTTEQFDTEKLHKTKSLTFIGSEDCAPPLISSNMDSAQIPNCVTLTGKMNKDQGYMVEKTAQLMKSQPKFKTRRAQKCPITYQTSNKSAQKRSDLRSQKITQRTFLSDGTKTTSPPYNACKKGKSARSHKRELQPKVSDLRQTRMEITNKIKAQLEQQEKDLATLRLKAEMEAREAERCMQEILRSNNLKDLPTNLMSKTMYPKDEEHQKFYKPGGAVQRFESALEGFLESASPNTLAEPVKQNALKTPDMLNILPNENDISEHSWDHTDTVTESTSKWSEVSQFYGSTNMLSRFTMEMAQQYLREEELRARHQTALLRLREDALKEKTKAELALLKHQRMYWEMKKEPNKVEEILRQEENIQKQLKQEQAEIQHFHNIYKAAHQERKLLLKQQKEILQIKKSATNIQQKLSCSGVQVSEQSELRLSSNQAVDSTLRNSVLSTEQLHQETESAISDLSVDDDIEDAQAEVTKWLQNAKGNPTMDGPDIHHTIPVLQKENQTRHTQEPQMIYNLPTKQDRADESNPLSAKSKPMMGSLQSPLTNLCQEFPMLQEDLCNHSQEKRNSANEDVLVLCVDIQETHIVPEKEKGENMDFHGHEMTKPEDTDNLDQQRCKRTLRNFSVITTDRETKEDAELVSKIRSDSILEPSESDVPTVAQGTGTLLPSFAEFHKVSAKLINISESSVSVSDWGQDDQDTESGDSDVFDMEPTGFPTGGVFSVSEDSVVQAFDPKLLGQSDENIIKSAFQGSYDGESGEKPSNPPSSQKESLNYRTPVALDIEETKPKKAPLAFESFPTSEDVTESDSRTYGIEHLLENQDGNTVKVTDLQKSTSMSPENISNVAGISLSDIKDWTRVTEMNVKQSFTENVISGKIETAPFHATTAKDLFEIKSFPHPSEGEVIFITDEVLQPIEDTLSEIFSPVDEKLSYGSGDLYSAKQDQSAELPSLPSDVDSIKSDDVDTEDFPTPPEEILFSETESLQSSQEASLIEEINLLYDNLLTEDALVPASKSMYELPNDGYIEAPPTKLEDKSNLHNVVGHCTPFLTLSKVEDNPHDPLFTFKIGDRVLVKLSKPGTLKYKGPMAFRNGYWAGVVLDEVEGDNDGTYEGIRYFECPAQYGVFVRPGQISHLLFDEERGSGTPGDDNNAPGEGSSPRNFRSQDQSGSDIVREGQGAENKKEQTSEKTINQARSCCLKTSEESSDTNACGIYPNGLKMSPLNENRDHGQASHISLFCAVDTDKIIPPCLLKKQQQTLVLKVTDELFSRVLSDLFATFANISQNKFNKDNVKQNRKTSEDSSEKYVAVHNKTHDKLQSLTTKRRKTGGCLENMAHEIVMEIIKDCIEKYKKKGKKNSWPIDNSVISLQSSEIHKDIENTMSLNKGKRTVIDTFADKTIEEILVDSLQLMENIRQHKADMSVLELS